MITLFTKILFIFILLIFIFLIFVKATFKLGYIVLVKPTQKFYDISDYLFLTFNFETLKIAKDNKFKNIVFQKDFEHIKKLQFNDGIFTIFLDNKETYPFNVAPLSKGLLTYMLEKFLAYQESLNDDIEDV